jgi:hypothetical protein
MVNAKIMLINMANTLGKRHCSSFRETGISKKVKNMATVSGIRMFFARIRKAIMRLNSTNFTVALK